MGRGRDNEDREIEGMVLGGETIGMLTGQDAAPYNICICVRLFGCRSRGLVFCFFVCMTLAPKLLRDAA